MARSPVHVAPVVDVHYVQAPQLVIDTVDNPVTSTTS